MSRCRFVSISHTTTLRVPLHSRVELDQLEEKRVGPSCRTCQKLKRDKKSRERGREAGAAVDLFGVHKPYPGTANIASIAETAVRCKVHSRCACSKSQHAGRFRRSLLDEHEEWGVHGSLLLNSFQTIMCASYVECTAEADTRRQHVRR